MSNTAKSMRAMSEWHPIAKEVGMPIMLKTPCRVGAHVWMWTSYQWAPNAQPEDRCVCGLMTWAERQPAPPPVDPPQP